MSSDIFWSGWLRWPLCWESLALSRPNIYANWVTQFAGAIGSVELHKDNEPLDTSLRNLTLLIKTIQSEKLATQSRFYRGIGDSSDLSPKEQTYKYTRLLTAATLIRTQWANWPMLHSIPLSLLRVRKRRHKIFHSCRGPRWLSGVARRNTRSDTPEQKIESFEYWSICLLCKFEPIAEKAMHNTWVKAKLY